MNAENLKLIAEDRIVRFVEDNRSEIIERICCSSDFLDGDYSIPSTEGAIREYFEESFEEMEIFGFGLTEILRYAVSEFDFSEVIEGMEEDIFGIGNDHLEIDAFGLRMVYDGK